MENLNGAFTTVVWNVKEGKEEEFIKEWTQLAKWSADSDTLSGLLLKDEENPGRFVSVGKWDNAETIKKWREKSEFKEAMSRISKLLVEPAQPHVMKEVAKIGEHVIA